MTRTGEHDAGWVVHLSMGFHRIVLASLCVVCAGLWMSSVKLLMASSWREQGRVLSCIYFDGYRMKEHQYEKASASSDVACPVIRLG